LEATFESIEQVGFVESEQQQERKSGVEAWSLRIQDDASVLVTKVDGGSSSIQSAYSAASFVGFCDRWQELAFPEFAARFTVPGGGDGQSMPVPYHRIAFIAHQGTRVWWVKHTCSTLLLCSIIVFW
jgi:hypothetical protein